VCPALAREVLRPAFTDTRDRNEVERASRISAEEGGNRKLVSKAPAQIPGKGAHSTTAPGRANDVVPVALVWNVNVHEVERKIIILMDKHSYLPF